MWVNRVSPASLCNNESYRLGREGSQCSSHQNVDQANSMDLFSQSGSSQSQQVTDSRESKEQPVALEKQLPLGQKYYMKFLSQLPKQDGFTCTAEQKAWGVAHSQQSLHSWNASQQEKTESKQLFDALHKLKEDLGVQFTEMVNTIRAEISQGFVSHKKTSAEPSLDSQYACVLTQLLQGQAEIRQDVQKVNERLEHLSSQVCKLEGAVSQHTATSNAAMATLSSTHTWATLSAQLDIVSSRLDMLVSAEHHRDIIVCKESRTDTFVSTNHHTECRHCTPVHAVEPTRDQAVPHPGIGAVQNEESIYPDQLPSHGKNFIHATPVTAHGLWTPSKLTRPSHSPRNREVTQPSVPTVCEPDSHGSTQKKPCTQPLSWSKVTRRGGGAISALSTPIGRRRSSRIHKRMDESSPVMPTDSPFSTLNSHKPVLATESSHMSQGQFQRSNEALRRRMTVMSDLSCCGDAMKEIVEALKQQKHTTFSP